MRHSDKVKRYCKTISGQTPIESEAYSKDYRTGVINTLDWILGTKKNPPIADPTEAKKQKPATARPIKPQPKPSAKKKAAIKPPVEKKPAEAAA